MANSYELERIAELEAKCYFEWGLTEEESDELDKLIKNTNRTLETDMTIETRS